MRNSLSYLWAILASVTWGLSYALDQKVLSSFSPLCLLGINATVTLLMIVPMFFLFPDGMTAVQLVSAKGWGLVLLTSCLAVLANLFIFYAIKYLGASSAAVLEISYPFFVILFAALLWKERPTPAFLVGAALIFCGSFIIARSHG